jgi:hypothetical protein
MEAAPEPASPCGAGAMRTDSGPRKLGGGTPGQILNFSVRHLSKDHRFRFDDTAVDDWIFHRPPGLRGRQGHAILSFAPLVVAEYRRPPRAQLARTGGATEATYFFALMICSTGGQSNALCGDFAALAGTLVFGLLIPFGWVFIVLFALCCTRERHRRVGHPANQAQPAAQLPRPRQYPFRPSRRARSRASPRSIRSSSQASCWRARGIPNTPSNGPWPTPAGSPRCRRSARPLNRKGLNERGQTCDGVPPPH